MLDNFDKTDSSYFIRKEKKNVERNLLEGGINDFQGSRYDN